MNRVVLILLFHLSIGQITGQVVDGIFTYQWATPTNNNSNNSQVPTYFINEDDCECCIDTLRISSKKDIIYILQNNRSELAAYKGKRRIWLADLKIILNSPNAKALCMEYNEFKNSKAKNISCISLSNHHQCIGVNLNPQTGKRIPGGSY